MKTRSETIRKEPFFPAFEHKLRNRESALQCINRDLLKYIALLLMTLGHWALNIYAFTHSKPFLQFSVAAQYFAPPVFFFFLTEGYHYTRSRSKYAVRLLIFAVITQIPHSLTLPGGLTLYNLLLQWNVIMTLFLGLAALIVLHCSWRLPLRLVIIAALTVTSRLLNSEWFVSGILIILLFDLLREKPLLRLIAYMALMFAVACANTGGFPALPDYFIYLLPVWSAGIVITFFYNGKKGHFPVFSKYFFYIWYPLHLLLQFFFK